jgi:hypothetical protein
MATIPGVRAAQVQDVQGRDAIALYRPDKSLGWDRYELLLDPGTYLYSGRRDVAQSDGEEWKKGEAVISSARLAMAVVDKKGERP